MTKGFLLSKRELCASLEALNTQGKKICHEFSGNCKKHQEFLANFKRVASQLMGSHTVGYGTFTYAVDAVFKILAESTDGKKGHQAFDIVQCLVTNKNALIKDPCPNKTTNRVMDLRLFAIKHDQDVDQIVSNLIALQPIHSTQKESIQHTLKRMHEISFLQQLECA